MNNKYIYIGIALFILVGGGFIYTNYFQPESSKPVSSGVIKKFTVTAEKDGWRFVPDLIEINQGDTVKLTIKNNDEYDHGFSVDAFGISQRIPANETIDIEFVATQPGDFPYYCSVPCGEGIVNGEKRGHFDQVGKIKVKAIMNDSTAIPQETN